MSVEAAEMETEASCSTWRRTSGAAPDAVKVARPVLNGGDEETGLSRPRLVATQRHGRLLFLPQQKQRDALTYEFAVDCGPIRHQVRRGDSGRDDRKQQPFQRALIIGV